MDCVKQKLKDGYNIKWVGYHGKRTVWVHMTKDQDLTKIIVPLKEDYTENSFHQIKATAADDPESVTGTIWSSDSRLELLRLASILGINVGGSCIPGCGQEFLGTMGHVMAYDIESDRSRIPSSSFGTLSELITSIATYCSCHEKRVFSLVPHIDFDYIYCQDSTDTVTQFIRYVQSHSPQWLLGYNNFGYDNTRIAYHSSKEFDSILIPMKVGSGSSLTYAFYIDIEGVYNVDLLTYLDKTRRSTYPSMSLAVVAKYHGVGEKMDFDTGNVTDFAELFKYNIQDSKITMELALKSNVLTEITSLCAASCSPVIDCIRFVSGTLAACSIASYCLQNKISMDWSPCTVIQDYRGAEVLTPLRGVHEDVVSCDFSSMYPTILIAANISIENCTITKSSKKEGSTWTSSSASSFVVGGNRLAFNNRIECVLPPVMKLFVTKRKAVKKSNPPYAFGLKITANSIYGSIGDKNSRIYSPNCSASVTTGGRWCLALADSIIRRCGFKVVYGDTDSCFVAPTKKAKYSIEDIMIVLSCIFNFTPFPGMSMEVENKYSKIAFLGKKTYFGKMTDGKIVSKGMSKSRKDRVGVCRSLASHSIPLLLSILSQRETRVCVADMISIVIDMAITRNLTLQDVSKIVKKGGSNYFEYKTMSGFREAVECESCTGQEIVAYSPKEICRLLVREMSAILAVTGIGSFSYIMKQSSII